MLWQVLHQQYSPLPLIFLSLLSLPPPSPSQLRQPIHLPLHALVSKDVQASGLQHLTDVPIPYLGSLTFQDDLMIRQGAGLHARAVLPGHTQLHVVTSQFVMVIPHALHTRIEWIQT